MLKGYNLLVHPCSFELALQVPHQDLQVPHQFFMIRKLHIGIHVGSELLMIVVIINIRRHNKNKHEYHVLHN